MDSLLRKATNHFAETVNHLLQRCEYLITEIVKEKIPKPQSLWSIDSDGSN